jgi:glycosyltransferase involved in cell wall biosynthesis
MNTDTPAIIPNLVSTIIPVHNRAAMLVEAVNSVLAQTHRPIEIIVVDDGSTDETIRVADDLATLHPNEIRVIHQQNTGAGLAREAGRRSANGEFIQYLDSDDLLLPHKFIKQVAGLKTHLNCGVSYGKTRYSTRARPQQNTACKRTGEEIPTMFPSMLHQRWWGTSTPLYRKSVTDLAGPWTSLCNEEDWEYDCRIASRDIRLHYVPDFVSEEREHEGDRLSANGSSDPIKLSDRGKAHALILEHAMRAGMAPSSPEMRHFARELFLLSRQCGAAGLEEESRQLFDLARQASGESRGKGWDFKLYHFLASFVGWTRLGRMACYSDGVRK